MLLCKRQQLVQRHAAGVFIIYIFMILVEHLDVVIHDIFRMRELREIVQDTVYPPDLLRCERLVELAAGEGFAGVVLLLHKFEHPAVELGDEPAGELPADVLQLVLIVERKADEPALRLFLPGELGGFGIYPVYAAGIYQLPTLVPRGFLLLSRNFALYGETDGLRRDTRGFGCLGDIHRPFERVMYRREEHHGFLEVGRAVLLLVEVQPGGLLAELVIYRAAGSLDEVRESLGAELLDVLVGVLCAGHLQYPRLDARLAEQVYPAGSGFLPGSVGIVGEYHLGFPHPPDEPRLGRGNRGAQRGDGAVEPRLVHGNNIHVALAEDEVIRLGILGVIKRKEVVALLENVGLRAVEVLRGGVRSERASAVGDDIAPGVEDREHHAVDELVVDAVIVPDEQRALHQLVLGEAEVSHVIMQLVVVVDRVADAEVADGVLGELTSGDVIPAVGALRGEQLPVEELPRLAVHFVEPLALSRGFVVAVLRHGEPGALREEPYRLDVVEVLDGADERYRVAARAAAEAVVALGVGVDMERRRSLRMERTAAGIGSPRALELDVIFDKRNYLVRVPDFLEKSLRQRHILTP